MGYYIGLDGGSTYLKAALIGDGAVMDTMVKSTGIDNDGTARKLTEELCRRNRIRTSDIGYIMATGYSRKVLEIADDDISEITAHAYGVRLTAPKQYRPGMIIAIGGQDSKIIYLDSHYGVKNFPLRREEFQHERQMRRRNGKVYGSDRPDPGNNDRSGRAFIPGKQKSL